MDLNESLQCCNIAPYAKKNFAKKKFAFINPAYSTASNRVSCLNKRFCQIRRHYEVPVTYAKKLFRRVFNALALWKLMHFDGI